MDTGTDTEPAVQEQAATGLVSLQSGSLKNSDAIMAAATVPLLIAYVEVRPASCASGSSRCFDKPCRRLSGEQGWHNCSVQCASARCVVEVRPARWAIGRTTSALRNLAVGSRPKDPLQQALCPCLLPCWGQTSQLCKSKQQALLHILHVALSRTLMPSFQQALCVCLLPCRCQTSQLSWRIQHAPWVNLQVTLKRTTMLALLALRPCWLPC